MKLIIEIPDDVYNKITEIYNSYEELHTRENLYQTIVNGKPYEERQLSHEQECIIEELENICINNEYVLDLLAKLKNEETPKGGKEE